MDRPTPMSGASYEFLNMNLRFTLTAPFRAFSPAVLLFPGLRDRPGFGS